MAVLCKRLASVAAVGGALVMNCFAAVYEVGPGKTYASIGAAPLSTLQPGDTVRIYYRSTPYFEKFVLSRQGTAAAPITIQGVAGPNGELPIIDGKGAITAAGQDFWNEERAVVKIGGSNIPADVMPRYLVVENLDIRGARPGYAFTTDHGVQSTYLSDASALYVERCEFCTIRNNYLHDAGNVLFVGSPTGTPSRNLLVQDNYIYDGGSSGNGSGHNVYTQAIGIVFEGNHLGRLVAGSLGNNIQDRSAGTVIRYNWIDGGNRQIDLVDATNSMVLGDPGYRSAYVYGNVLIEHQDTGSPQMMQYGGDTGTTANYHKGTVYVFNNTFISLRTDSNTWFRISTNQETAEVRNNIFYSTLPGTNNALTDAAGVFLLSHNWMLPGWLYSPGNFSGTVINDGTMVLGSSPGFVNEAAQDYHLASGSPCIDKGGLLAPAAVPSNNLVSQYKTDHLIEVRASDAVLDIGAFEFSSGTTTNQSPVALIQAIPVSGTAPLAVAFSGTSSHDPDGSIVSYAWTFGDGTSGSGATVNHTYSAGSFTATLRVTDNSGITATATQAITVATVTVNTPPVAAISATPTSGVAPLAVTFSAAGSSDPGGSISSYAWTFGDGTTGTGVTASHSYQTAGTFIAKVTVTDNLGATTNQTVTITVTAATSGSGQTSSNAMGKGCTSATSIDMDCDGYGVASAKGPDADDNDPAVYNYATAMAKWGTLKAFLAHLGYQPTRFLYISPSGSNSTGVANDVNRPFATLAGLRAKITLTAGDIVLARSGTYNETFSLAYPAVSGVSGNPVIFMAYPGERPIWSASTDVVNSTTDINNVVFDGLAFTSPQAGSGRTFFLQGKTQNITIRNCESWNRTNGVFAFENMKTWLIENNVFRDNRNGTHCIYIGSRSYPNQDVTVRGNLLYNCGSTGFQHNGRVSNLIVEGNIIHSNKIGGISLVNGVHDSLIHNNVVFNNGSQGIVLYDYSDVNAAIQPYDTFNNVIEHNTVWIGSTSWGQGSGTSNYMPLDVVNSSVVHWTFPNNTVRNNVFVSYGGPMFRIQQTFLAMNTWTVENNVFYSVKGAPMARVYQNFTTLYKVYQTLTAFETIGSNYRNNINANPQFADVNTSYWGSPQNFNFHLLPGSPAFGAGVSSARTTTDIRGRPRSGTPTSGAYE